jgi:hypothetical protein
VENDLKQRILANQFVEDIRYLRVNRTAYRDLCSSLKELATAWHRATSIDRELAAELYLLVRVTENIALKMSEDGMPEASEVIDMAHFLDGLVLDCFGGGIPLTE